MQRRYQPERLPDSGSGKEAFMNQSGSDSNALYLNVPDEHLDASNPGTRPTHVGGL
jgi:hypothetical protein